MDAVKKFAKSLRDGDQMAILCIMSHGSVNKIFGSDGKRISLDAISAQLNNHNCPVMIGKPKLIIIQACQGGNIFN